MYNDEWVPVRYVYEFLMMAADCTERLFDPKDDVSMAYAHGYKAAAIEARKIRGLTLEEMTDKIIRNYNDEDDEEVILNDNGKS